MIDWLAVIVICAGGECKFWADSKTPHPSQEACAKVLVEMSRYFAENGVEPALGTCIPVKFVKV